VWYPARLTPTIWGPGVWEAKVYGVTCPVPVLSRVIAAPAGLDVTSIDPVVGAPPTTIVPGTTVGLMGNPFVGSTMSITSRLSDVDPGAFPLTVRVTSWRLVLAVLNGAPWI